MATTHAARVHDPHRTDTPHAPLRSLLMTDRAAREALIATHATTVTELTGQGDSSSPEREFTEGSIARTREALGEIDAALDRMDAGTYGRCEACGAPIPSERLEVMPAVRHCVLCSRGRSILRSAVR
jgi:DnaK suppressor protein